MKRIGAVLTGIILLGGLTGCGSSGTSRTGTTETTQSPPPATTATTSGPSSTTAPGAPVDLRVYFLHGDKLDVAHRAVPATVEVARAALTELLAGPTPADVAAGLASTVPAGTRLLGIDVAGGTATVDLSGEYASGGGSLSMTARLAQVTFTLTQFPTVKQVTFKLDGKPVTVFGGEGIVLDHPSTRASFESVTPPILVEFPARGAMAGSPVRISGSANVFEAQFRVELTDPAGRVLASKAVTATAGTGTRGTFDTSVAYSGYRGAATLTAFDVSPKDGSRIDVVRIPLQLTG